MATTRGGVQTSITNLIGPAKPLPVNDLSTNRCVLQQMLQLRQEDSRYSRQISNTELAAQTAELVINNWKRVNAKIVEKPVIITKQQIAARLNNLWVMVEKFANPRKVTKRGRGNKKRKSGEFQSEKEEFLKKLDKLFNILHCHCPISTCTVNKCDKTCKMKVHISCTCTKDMKIPTMELEFLYYQREKTGVKSKMMMANPDIVETKRQIKQAERKEKERMGQEKLDLNQNSFCGVADFPVEEVIDQEELEGEGGSDKLDRGVVERVKMTARQNTLHFPLNSESRYEIWLLLQGGRSTYNLCSY